MTMVLNLTKEEEARLRRAADRRGVDATSLLHSLIDSLDEPVESTKVESQRTGAELIADWEKQGLIGIWADRDDISDSLEYARELRSKAEHRSRD